ncbi:hypothetical protein KAR91_83425 [Candidatus Pacearchaeota archaeon]|nr:hypothetical protein [Candidatus Pacearchaeota archaeon]
MKVEELFKKYHQIVAFPWSPSKIKKAGHNPIEFLLQFGREIGQCEDAGGETAKELIKMFKELGFFG